MRPFWPFRSWQLRSKAGAMASAATDLFGADAYQVARICAGKPGAQKDRFWSAVAVRIADRTGREIGVKGGDRWPEP